MKIYYFTVIAVGIMFLLFLGGIETNSSKLLDAIGGVNPSGWESSTLWIIAIATFTGFVATTRITIGGYSLTPSIEAVVAVFVAAMYVLFASDMYSIVTKIGESSCDVVGTISTCGWEYLVAWAIILPLMAGYTISLISYIRGAD